MHLHVAVHAILAMLLAWGSRFFSDGFALSYGVIVAQASLLGVYLGLGNSRMGIRIAMLILGLAWLMTALNLHDNPNTESGDFVPLILIAAAAGAVFATARFRGGYVLDDWSAASDEGLPTRLRTWHLLLLMTVMAILLAVLRVGIDSELGVIPFVILVVGGWASVSIVPCWLMLARGRIGLHLLSACIFCLIMVGALTLTAYFQTDSMATAREWCVIGLSNAIYVALACASLRKSGYGVRQATGSLESGPATGSWVTERS